MNEMMALQEYSKDLDLTRACAAAGYKRPSQAAERMLQHPKIRNELEAIYNIWRTNFEMTAEHASAKHINLMKKFEKDYDETGDAKFKGTLSGTLSKMSDSYLRASGHFNRNDETTDKQIVINIDLGGKDDRNADVIDVEPEK